MLFTIVYSLQIFLCIVLVALVLLQQGKGADLGAALGGSSNSLFGAGGASTILVKITTIAAILFFVLSILLVRVYQGVGRSQGGTVSPLQGSVLEGIPDAPSPAASPGVASVVPGSAPLAPAGSGKPADGSTETVPAVTKSNDQAAPVAPPVGDGSVVAGSHGAAPAEKGGSTRVAPEPERKSSKGKASAR